MRKIGIWYLLIGIRQMYNIVFNKDKKLGSKNLINIEIMKKILIILIIGIFFLSCNNEAKQPENIANPPSVVNTDTLQILPILPVSNIQNLMNNANRIDYIFYNYGKSINQTDNASVQSMIRQITAIPQGDINCAVPFCKVIFYKIADKLLEGEIHFGNGCAYFVFPDVEGKPQYTSKMGDSGILFFNDLINKFSPPAGQ